MSWISVEDKLPELDPKTMKTEPVIVFMPFGKKVRNDYMVKYSDDDAPIWFNSYQFFVSHWQPINAPAQKEYVT